MDENVDELKESYRDINSRIRELQNKLKSTRDSMGQRRVVEELSKLEQEKMEVTNLFSPEQADDVEAEEGGDTEFPLLHGLSTTYPDLVERHRKRFRDIRALILYMQYFDDEFIGLFTERRLRLDVKYSIERDGFYNRFTELQRKLREYIDEAERFDQGQYAKNYEEELLRRLVEMRHGLFIESDRFFDQVHRFAAGLLDDIESDGILCQNGHEKLDYSSIDREKVLRGCTVHDGLERLYDVTDEILNYLDVPDFQR